MKSFSKKDINTPEYWDTHQTALDFGLRQKKYLALAGTGQGIVELGCGLSPMLHYADFHERVGVDFSFVTCDKARELYPNVTYVCADVVNTPFASQSFDVSVSGEVIEHLRQPDKLIKEMERITKKGGKIIISTPILEFDDPEHLWEFDETYFIDRGFKTEVIASSRFAGRYYIFAHKVV
jgi:ubiquinone/menaquinone biosynthesis C-methylase UbiE